MSLHFMNSRSRLKFSKDSLFYSIFFYKLTTYFYWVFSQTVINQILSRKNLLKSVFGSCWLSLSWRALYKTYYLANYADETIQFIDSTHWQPINLNQSIEARTCSHWGTERQYRDLHRCHILCQWWWASQTCRQSIRRGHVGGTAQSLGLSRCWPGLQFGDRQDFCCHSAHLGDIGKLGLLIAKLHY